MNSPRKISPRIPRNELVRRLIVEDLGYCCEWKFFALYHDTDLIAARLGVSTRTIRRHKAAAAEGELRCEDSANCMKCKKPIVASR